MLAQQLVNHSAVTASSKDDVIAKLRKELADSRAACAQAQHEARAANARTAQVQATAAAQVSQWRHQGEELKRELDTVRREATRAVNDAERAAAEAADAASAAATERRALVLALAAVAAELMGGNDADAQAAEHVRRIAQTRLSCCFEQPCGPLSCAHHSFSVSDLIVYWT